MISDVESVPLSDGGNGLVVLDANFLKLLLDVLGDLAVHVCSCLGLLLSKRTDHFSALLPDCISVSVREPSYVLDEFFGHSCDFILIGLDPEVHLKVILPEATVDTFIFAFDV